MTVSRSAIADAAAQRLQAKLMWSCPVSQRFFWGRLQCRINGREEKARESARPIRNRKRVLLISYSRKCGSSPAVTTRRVPPRATNHLRGNTHKMETSSIKVSAEHLQCLPEQRLDRGTGKSSCRFNISSLSCS